MPCCLLACWPVSASLIAVNKSDMGRECCTPTHSACEKGAKLSSILCLSSFILFYYIFLFFPALLSLACPWGIEYLMWKEIQWQKLRVFFAGSQRTPTHTQHESPLLEQSASFGCLENSVVSGQRRHVQPLLHGGKTNICSWSLSICVRMCAWTHTQVQKNHPFSSSLK